MNPEGTQHVLPTNRTHPAGPAARASRWVLDVVVSSPEEAGAAASGSWARGSGPPPCVRG